MRICFAVDDGPEIEEAFEFYYDTIHDKANEIIICHISKNAEAEINQLHLGACKTVKDHEGSGLSNLWEILWALDFQNFDGVSLVVQVYI